MQQADYKIVSYRPEYIPQILEVQNYLWGRDTKLNAEYFDWKYLRNPYIREPLIYLTIHGGKVVGMRGFIGAKWEYGSPRQTLVLPLAGDTVIAPGHRNSGLMALTMKFALDDLARKGYTYSVSMAAGSITFMNLMTTGWRRVGSLQPMECTAAQSESLPRRRANGQGILDSISIQKKLGRHISIEKSPRPREMADLAGAVGSNDERIRQVKDEEYFAWRFHNPRSEYRFVFWRSSQLEGYLVLQATVYKPTMEVNIIDWEAASDCVRAELFDSAIQAASSRILVMWAGTLKESERHILEAAGFKALEQNAIMNPLAAAVRPVCDEALKKEWLLGNQRLLDMGNWDFRMLHSRAY